MAILLGAGTSRAEEAAYITLNRLGNALRQVALEMLAQIPTHRLLNKRATLKQPYL